MNFLKIPKKNDGTARRHNNLLALDFSTSGVKAVRLKKGKDRIELVAAEILPPCDPKSGVKPDLPKSLAAYYAALCATMDNVTLRVFDGVPGADGDIEAMVRENFSAAGDCRVSGLLLSQTKGKRESSILGVSVPGKTVQDYLSLFEDGAPAPRSLEVSGLAAFSAFLYNRGEETADKTVCLIETGIRHTFVAFLHRNQLQLVNRFDVGGGVLRKQVQTALGVTEEMAGTILCGGSVDVSLPIRQVLSPFIRQLSVYRDFIERQNKCPLSAVYISGGLAGSSYWQSAIKEVLGSIPQNWNPFEKIEVPSGAFPDKFKGQESRFAAVVGAALAGMETV
jgi:Tfp pilus assembly PilM family ATPase